MRLNPISFLALSLIIPGSATLAALPGTRDTDTRGLVENSPFTSKPQVHKPTAASPLESYTLIGVSPVSPDGFRVTLGLRDNPAERITIESGAETGRFEILGVNREANHPARTSVTLRAEGHTGTITFDPAILKPVGTPAPKPQSTAPAARHRVAPPTQ